MRGPDNTFKWPLISSLVMSGEVVEQLTIFRAEATPSWSHIYRRQPGGNTYVDDDDDDEGGGDDDNEIHFHTLGYRSDIFVAFYCLSCWHRNTTDISKNTLFYVYVVHSQSLRMLKDLNDKYRPLETMQTLLFPYQHHCFSGTVKKYKQLLHHNFRHHHRNRHHHPSRFRP